MPRPDLRHQSRELAEAARLARGAYGAARSRTVVRALALRAAGRFAVRDSLSQGLLDPAMPLRRALRERVSKPRAMRVQERYNPAGHRHLLDDKEAFARAAAEHGLPAVRTIAVVGGAEPELGAGGAPLGGPEGWAELLAGDPARGIVVKPVGGGHGAGVRVVEIDGGELVEGERRWMPEELLASIRTTGRHVVQERVADHPDLQRINPTRALQTARLTTLEHHGAVNCVQASVKLAMPDALTDNFAGGRTGTMMAVVDTATGVITELWVPRPGGVGAVQAERHPRTRGVVVGRALPLWDDALALAVRATRAFAPLRTIGWDVALTADGPLLVEGNARWDPLPHRSSGELIRRMRGGRPPVR